MWIARDKNDDLFLYSTKPYKIKDAGYWEVETPFLERISRLYSEIFPEVKWEDEEPRELILK